MNHDYAHCLDCRDDCPKKCFRAELVRDLSKYENIVVSWMHFEGTEECMRKDDKEPQVDLNGHDDQQYVMKVEKEGEQHD